MVMVTMPTSMTTLRMVVAMVTTSVGMTICVMPRLRLHKMPARMMVIQNNGKTATNVMAQPFRQFTCVLPLVMALPEPHAPVS